VMVDKNSVPTILKNQLKNTCAVFETT
jgi:hypothetical protein